MRRSPIAVLAAALLAATGEAGLLTVTRNADAATVPSIH
jgi:hypothetical protein